MTSTTSAETCLPKGDIEVCPRPSPSVFDTTATPSPPPSIITTPASTATPMATQEPSDGDSIMLLEPRPFRPFKTSEEYLYAMKEDLADWLNNLYSLDINVDNFFERLDTGEVLCAHANNVRRLAEERRTQDTEHQHSQAGGRRFSSRWDIPQYDVVYRQNINPGSFFARDNVHNFITWCRDLGIYEVLLFETDDLVLRKNEKHVILSLLEVARRQVKTRECCLTPAPRLPCRASPSPPDLE
ncbi:GAS2-like protein pickled eggs [Eriocheir sinensis]|uniref:GAS2-like protein pickled eggs n=1 Tax=Eriocheir sinensis TaxID=95602 RepID=UPI0021CA55CB|nr:GAS2-like protein pickled eggs [Eriocheir sinensis]